MAGRVGAVSTVASVNGCKLQFFLCIGGNGPAI